MKKSSYSSPSKQDSYKLKEHFENNIFMLI